MLFFVLFILFFIHTYGLHVWPYPSSVLTEGLDQLQISPSFSFSHGCEGNDVLATAFKRYENLIHSSLKGRKDVGENTLDFCSVVLQDSTTLDLEYGVDESYTLSVNVDDGCHIAANTTWGALRGLETFSQLLGGDGEGNFYVNYLPLELEDEPRYSHRGILIDTSRHYLPLSTLYKVVESLEYHKMNVLHWHLVDAQSFPFESSTTPSLVEGAYSPLSTYSQEDIQQVVTYAYLRGIRVMLEVDIPGHAYSWGVGDSSLTASCPSYEHNVNNIPLNPANEDTFTAVNGVLSELTAGLSSSPKRPLEGVHVTSYDLPQPWVHLGGDEVVYGCWGQDSEITSWMSQQGFTSYDQVYDYFYQRVLPTLTDETVNAQPLFWEEAFDANAPSVRNSDPIFEAWKGSSSISPIVAAGYRVVAAPSDVWYLNYVSISWEDAYAYDPADGLTAEEQKLLMGGEGALWGEMIDEQNLLPTLYPRLLAISERLWSPASKNDITEATDRLVDMRCRLSNRDVPSAPVQPSFCQEMTWV